MSNEKEGMPEFPPGFAFNPTDEELLKFYLSPKILGEPVPHSSIMNEIDERELYSKPPNKLEMNSSGRKQWFFFIHQDILSHDGLASLHVVGNGIGFWMPDIEGTDIYDSDGEEFGLKGCWTYYNGALEKGERTNWVMHEYRLQMENEDNNQENAKRWTLRWIKECEETDSDEMDSEMNSEMDSQTNSETNSEMDSQTNSETNSEMDEDRSSDK